MRKTPANSTPIASNHPAHPTPSFVELCGFIAIRQSQDSEEVVRRLLLNCFVFEADQRYARASDFREVIQRRFNLHVPEHRVQSAVDKLINEGRLLRQANRDITISPTTKSQVDAQVNEVRAQEEAVRQEWLADVARVSPAVPGELAWTTLTTVLRKLFRRHGLQTLSLLDSSLEMDEADEKGVRAQVRDVCAELPTGVLREDLEAAIIAFLNGAHALPERANYIARLADSAVSYLSLTVPPEVADRLRRKLQRLDVFLDTNVLFGLLGLAEPEVTDAARELAKAVQDNNLPLQLRFHADTEQELRSTFDGLAIHLRSRVWSPAISAAAIRAKNINTLSRLYHERNASTSISADSFLQPYQHADIIIRERGAIPYRESDPLPSQPIYDLMHDFQEFLKQRGRDKRYESIKHDMTLLSTVRRLRVSAKSSLDSRAILLTNDVLLHLFEVASANREHRPPCTLLLRQLLQLLRPFVATTPDFDLSFAETFSAPEFRSLDSKAALATAKLLELLAAYRDMTEETASALLANDMLLGKLQSEPDNKAMAVMVDSALAIENSSLQAERDSLAAKLQRTEQDREKTINEVVSALSSDFELQQSALLEEQNRIASRHAEASEKLATAQRALDQHFEEIERERAARLAAEARTEQIQAELQAKADLADRKRKWNRTAVSLAVTVVAVTSVETAISLGYLPWLASHHQSYGLRIGAYFGIGLGLLGLARPEWRRGTWIVGVVPIFYVLLQLLGGPSAEPATPRTGAPSKDNPASDIPRALKGRNQAAHLERIRRTTAVMRPTG